MKPLASPPIGISDQPSVAYPKGRVIRLAGGLVCPNCNQMLRACDVIVDNLDLTLLCWELSRRYLVGRERSGFRRVIKSQNFKGLIDQTMENQNV